MRTSVEKRAGSFLAGVTVLAVLLALLAQYGLHLYKAGRPQENRDWPAIQAKVDGHEIKNGELDGTMYSSGEITEPYYIALEVSYSPAGSEARLTSHSSIFENLFKTEAEARQAATEKYPIGSELTVYYNPNQLTECQLYPPGKASLEAIVLGFLRSLFVALAIFLGLARVGWSYWSRDRELTQAEAKTYGCLVLQIPMALLFTFLLTLLLKELFWLMSATVAAILVILIIGIWKNATAILGARADRGDSEKLSL